MPGPGNVYRNSGWYYTGFRPVPVVNGPAGWAPPTRPPVAGVGASAYAPTVKVGTIGNLPAAIPGGRIPPNFRSVVPGATAFAHSNAVSPTVRQQATFARPTAAPYHGHVFASPARGVTRADSPAMWSGGSGAAMGMGVPGGFHSMGTAGASRGMGGGGASHASGGHGSPK